MTLKQYASEDVSVTIGTEVAVDFGETFIEVEYNEDTFTHVVSADGHGTRVKNANQSGTIRLTLKQSSPTNELMSRIALADRATGRGVFSCQIKDRGGSSLHFSAQSYIRKEPTSSYGTELKELTWTIHCDKLMSSPGRSYGAEKYEEAS